MCVDIPDVFTTNVLLQRSSVTQLLRWAEHLCLSVMLILNVTILS